MLDSTQLIRDLVAEPGPPGQEEAIRDLVARHARDLGYETHADAKGNLLVSLSEVASESPRIVVMAHLDEIALMVQQILPDGALRVVPLGGAYPWKWGEQPVEILARGELIPGVLSFGCIHTNSAASVAQQGREGPLQWDQAYVFTGLDGTALAEHGVRPGVRVVLARDVRKVREVGPYLVSYFLDDRADLAVWLMALEALKGVELPGGVLFAATACEEVGGEGALYILHQHRPEICVALEIGPSVPESPFHPDSQPTIWVTDSFSSIKGADIRELEEVCEEVGVEPHWQALSRGGSDASCAAAQGLTARPITLGLPVENSHGLEIMHCKAPDVLCRLLVAYLKRVAA
jgi:putative aminopeptidase FrvX